MKGTLEEQDPAISLQPVLSSGGISSYHGGLMIYIDVMQATTLRPTTATRSAETGPIAEV